MCIAPSLFYTPDEVANTSFVEILPEDTERLVADSKPSKACGQDGLTARLLKDCNHSPTDDTHFELVLGSACHS